MTSKMIDWESTTHEERKCLYHRVRQLRRREKIQWSDLFQTAFGPRDSVEIGYEDNFRKGKIAPDRAYKLFQWLQSKDPHAASLVEDAIFDLQANRSAPRLATWTDLLASAEFSNLVAHHHSKDLGITQFARKEPISNLELNLLDPFYFEIDMPFSGYLTAFQDYKGTWHHQPISMNEAVLKLEKGKHIIPADDHGQALPLHEETDIGKHSYLFLTLRDDSDIKPLLGATSIDHAIPPRNLNKIAQAVLAKEKTERRLFRINLFFKP